MDSTTILIVVLVLSVAAYIAQNILVKQLYMKTGNYLKTGKIWPVLSFFGIFMIVALPVMSGGNIIEALTSSTLELVIFLVCVAGFVILLVRNIKGAGVGMGILLTVLQSAAGLLITLFGALKIGTVMTMSQLGAATKLEGDRNAANRQEAERRAWEAQRQAAEREKAEAYAHHDGFDSLQDAVDAGAADPDQLKKD